MATYELKSIIIIIIYVTYGKETAPYSFWWDVCLSKV
jgi:hypothetical protein